MITPKKIERQKHALVIVWENGAAATLSAQKLRDNCPCAGCREKRGDSSHATPITSKPKMLKVISHSAEESLSLTQIWAIGNYALGIRWADGHDDGIYTWELLYQLTDAQ